MTSEVTSAPPSSSSRRRVWALAVIAVAQLMIVLDASVVIVALPSAQRSLHMSVASRQWMMTAYTLSFGTLLLLGGRVADYMGRRRTFIIGLLGFGAASALGGLAGSSATLFGARALQGAFAALMAPSSLSLLTITFTEAKERARAFGVYGAVAGSGAAIGLVLGGALTQFASWRWTLLINVPIAILAGIVGRRVLDESRSKARGGYDLAGATSVTAALFLLVYGFAKAETDGWGAPLTMALLLGSVLGLVVFVTIEMRSRYPLLPLRVVIDRNRGGSYLASLLVGCAMLGTFLFLTYFFQGTLGYSALRTGFAFLPFSVGIIAGASAASWVLPRSGPRTLMTTGLAMAGVGLLWYTQLQPGASYLASVLPAELLVSVGMGLSFVPMSSTALIGVSESDSGVASALVNTTQQAGSSLGTALLNTVAATATSSFILAHPHLPHLSELAPVHGYSVGFALSAALVLVAAAVAALVIRAGPAEVGPSEEYVPLVGEIEEAVPAFVAGGRE